MVSNGLSDARLCLYPDPTDELPPHLAGAPHSSQLLTRRRQQTVPCPQATCPSLETLMHAAEH